MPLPFTSKPENKDLSKGCYLSCKYLSLVLIYTALCCFSACCNWVIFNLCLLLATMYSLLLPRYCWHYSTCWYLNAPKAFVYPSQSYSLLQLFFLCFLLSRSTQNSQRSAEFWTLVSWKLESTCWAVGKVGQAYTSFLENFYSSLLRHYFFLKCRMHSLT